MRELTIHEKAYLDHFREMTVAKIDALRACGALADDTGENDIIRYALILAAENIYLSERHRRELANLRHF